MPFPELTPIEFKLIATFIRHLRLPIIVERETTTVVTSTFDAVIQDDGSILLVRKGAPR